MNRREWIYLMPLLAGCGTPRPKPPSFPPDPSGVWRLKSSTAKPIESAPELVRKIGVRGYWSAIYDGPGSATVDAYELTSSAGGLEMVQRWRPEANTLVFYTPIYFVTVKWQSEDRSAVQALVRTLEKELDGKG
jgi:hypothetical protein